MEKEGSHFAGSEIVELGIQIEKNGRDFYKVLIVKSKSPRAKEVFKYLADQEEQHINDFEKILDSAHKYEPRESYPEEYFAYMNAIASEHVFTKKDKGKEIARSITTDKQAIELGIGLEKDSILFYEGIKRMLPGDDQKLIDKLISQEQDHLSKLWDLKTKA